MSDILRGAELDAYLRRVTFEGRAHADLATLQGLHRCHPQSIPFENLNLLLGEPVLLDLGALYDKLVGAGRGGYCFEQNALFAAVLETLGFDVTTLAARVSWHREADDVGGRTHMLLRVRVSGQDYLCDVGFGGVTLNMPLLLAVGVEQSAPQERFRVVMRDDGDYELCVELGDVWQPMYRFDLQPQRPSDYEIMNYYVSTHSSSPFIDNLVAARRTAAGRYALRNTRLATYRGAGPGEFRQLKSVSALRAALSEELQIVLPARSDLDVALARIVERDLRSQQ